jgi:uncharacterized protein
MANLQINVAQLLKENTGSGRSFDVDGTLYLDESTRFIFQGEVELVRTPRGILVRGAFTGTGNLACSRCLTLFEYPLSFAFEEEFLPSVDVNTGAPIASEEEPSTFLTDEHHMLDLSEAVRQYALLAIPMKPMCQSDCAGLCPQCGANLSQGSCSCHPRSGNLPESELTKLNDLARKLR